MIQGLYISIRRASSQCDLEIENAEGVEKEVLRLCLRKLFGAEELVIDCLCRPGGPNPTSRY